MAKFYHYTAEAHFRSIVNSAGDRGRLEPSGIIQSGPGSIDYGTGWYITPLPPTTSTEDLLSHLWQSDPAQQSKTAYWLELEVPEHAATIPDPARPFVALIPFYRQQPSVDGPSVSVVGSFGGAVFLIAGGQRVEAVSGEIEVTTLYRPVKSAVAVQPFSAAISGIKSMPWAMRQGVKDLYKIEDPTDSFHIQVEKLIDESDTLYKRGEFAAALVAIEAAIDLDPQVALAWDNKGAILAGLGRREEALLAFQRAIEIDPTHVTAFRNAAASLSRPNRFKEAIVMCDRALSIAPRDADIWTNKGAALLGGGNEDKALKAFERALEIDPKIAQAWNNRGGIMARRAISAAEGLTQNPVGVSELISTAIESFVRAIECNPDYRGAREGLRNITEVALNALPWTWSCEDALWRAIATDADCVGSFAKRIMKQGVEFHPRYEPVVTRKGYDLRDGKTILQIISEAFTIVRRWEWNTEALLGSAGCRFQIGACLLADLLSRCGLAKLAIRLGEFVTKAGTDGIVIEEGTLLQVAKALGSAGVCLRRGGAHDQAIGVYQKAAAIYERCNNPKWVAHMTFNIGAAYAVRNHAGDKERAKPFFEAAFELYTKCGLTDEREAAERQAKEFLRLAKVS